MKETDPQGKKEYLIGPRRRRTKIENVLKKLQSIDGVSITKYSASTIAISATSAGHKAVEEKLGSLCVIGKPVGFRLPSVTHSRKNCL